ncbi:4726_t:CDS:1, partial [Racocetra fulgida]
GQSTVGNSTYTTDNHGFVYLLTTSTSVTVDSCVLCPSIRYLNSSLKRDTYALGFANPNNVDYYLTISLKLSPSVTSQANYPTNAFNPNPTNAFKPSSSQSNTPGSNSNQQDSSSNNTLLVGVGVGAGVLLVGMLALLGFFYFYNKRRTHHAIIEMPGSNTPY